MEAAMPRTELRAFFALNRSRHTPATGMSGVTDAQLAAHA